MGIFDFFSNKFKKGNKQIEPSSFGVDPSQNLPEPPVPQSTSQDDSLLTENNKAWEEPKNEEPAGNFSFVPQGDNIVPPAPTPVIPEPEPQNKETQAENQGAAPAEPRTAEANQSAFTQMPAMGEVNSAPISSGLSNNLGDKDLVDGAEVNLSPCVTETTETSEIQENMASNEPFEAETETTPTPTIDSPLKDVQTEDKSDDQMPHYNDDVINYDEEETYKETPETPPTPEGEYVEDYSGEGNMSADSQKDDEQITNLED